MASGTTTPTGPAPAARTARRGFTLVELLVVVVLITLLASMTLSGLAVARQRARLARTKSTIRKLHEIVVPHYESYLRRRVPFAMTASARTNATNRLRAIRELMVFEMPDSWDDVGGSVPPHCQTGPVRAYAVAKSAATAANGPAECLYLIVSRGGLEPDLLEQFRSDEIGDVDKDGAPEFLDGWNQPIIFLRWAPGFSSALQVPDATNHHDPFDPQRVDAAGYALVPLIVSGGGDRTIGLWFDQASGWQQWRVSPGLQTIVGLSNPVLGSVASVSVAADNVTNHDLNVK